MRRPLVNKQRSMTRRIIIIMVITIIVVSTSAMLVNLLLLSQKNDRQFDETRKKYASFLSEGLKIPLWNYDYPAAQKLGAIMAKDEHVSSLAIRDSKGEVLFAVRKTGIADDTVEKVDVSYQNRIVGTFVLGLTKKFYDSQRKQIAMTFLIKATVLTISIFLVVTLSARSIINKPLNAFSKKISALAHGEYKEETTYIGYRELSPILEQFNQMAMEISRREQSLKNANTRLQAESEERDKAHQMLGESEERFKSLTDNIPVGIFRGDIKGRIHRYNPALMKMFGFTSDAQIKAIRTKDLYVDPEARKPYLETMASVGEITGHECQMRRMDGSPIWVTISAKGVTGPDGTIEYVDGIVEDITTRKKDEERLGQYHDELEGMVRERTKELSVTVDQLKRRNAESDTMSRLGDLLQVCENEEESFTIIANLCGQIFSCHSGFLGVYDDKTDTIGIVAEFGGFAEQGTEFELADCWALRRGAPHLVMDPDMDPTCPHAHGEQQLSSLCVPVIAKGEFLGLLHLLWDMRDKSHEECEREAEAITGLAKRVAELYALSLSNIRLRASLRLQSIRDPLTGLYNRRHMEDALRREILRAERKKSNVSVLIFDVDHFKNFNDTHGHEAGDEVLRRMGRLLKTMTRGEDIPCRYGGEEFLVILPDCPMEVALRRAEQFRESIEKMNVPYNGNQLTVTVSMGVACYPNQGDAPEQLIAIADAALYRAKATGRNRVVTAE